MRTRLLVGGFFAVLAAGSTAASDTGQGTSSPEMPATVSHAVDDAEDAPASSGLTGVWYGVLRGGSSKPLLFPSERGDFGAAAGDIPLKVERGEFDRQGVVSIGSRSGGAVLYVVNLQEQADDLAVTITRTPSPSRRSREDRALSSLGVRFEPLAVPRVSTYTADVEGDSFSFENERGTFVEGTMRGDSLRLTLDSATRTVVRLRRCVAEGQEPSKGCSYGAILRRHDKGRD